MFSIAESRGGRAIGRGTMAENPGAAALPSSRIRYLWPLAIAVLIFVASSRSRVAAPHVTAVDDKIVHFAVYGLLGTLVCRAGSGWRGAAWSLLAVSTYGASDELHQSFVPGRAAEVMDWVADTAGAAVAIALYVGWARYRGWLEWPLGRRAQKGLGSPAMVGEQQAS